MGPPPARGVGAQGLTGPFWSSALSDPQGGGLSRGLPSEPFTQEGLSQPEAGAPGIFVLASVDFSVPSHQPSAISFLCFHIFIMTSGLPCGPAATTPCSQGARVRSLVSTSHIPLKPSAAR